MDIEAVDTAMLIADYQQLFLQTDAGKRVLKDLSRKGFLADTSMDPNPHITSFNEGRRAMILEIMQILQTDVEEFLSGQFV